jgi:predicted lipid-binding transport protein (Tim44 family)
VRRPRRRLVALLLGVLLVVLVADRAHARPGGGHTYSSGHRSGRGGGGSGHDGGGLVFFLIRLVIEAPAIGIPVVILVGAVYVMARRSQAAENWEHGSASGSGSAAQGGAPRLGISPPTEDVGLASLQQRDPEFSAVLFDDFCYALYARAQEARANPEALSTLSPYLGPRARGDLQGRALDGAPVQAVVIGEMRVTDVVVPGAPTPNVSEPTFVLVSVDFVANLSFANGPTQYVREGWRLARSSTAVTRPWKGTRTFNCPACGAPLEASGQSRCASCGNAVDDGQFDWQVRDIALYEVVSQPPALTQTVEERGTDQPTVFQQGSLARWTALMRDDPSLTAEGFEARLRLIFAELERAWEALDLSLARPFISDGLHNYLQYWIDAYRAQGLRNVNEGAALSRWNIVKVLRDKHYDAVTVRLWAGGRDSTVEVATGKVVSGNPRVERRYSEYWTLVRGASARGAPKVDKTCPGCGAPLRVNMTGNCEYCNVLITSGDFDWVLSRIEQDESYEG